MLTLSCDGCVFVSSLLHTHYHVRQDFWVFLVELVYALSCVVRVCVLLIVFSCFTHTGVKHDCNIICCYCHLSTAMCMPLLEQECLPLPEFTRGLNGSFSSIVSFLCSISQIFVCLFVRLLSNFWILVCLIPFLFWPLCWLSFNLRVLLTPLASSKVSKSTHS